MRELLPGARITHGPMDWQVLQRRLDGLAEIPLAGVWKTPTGRPARVEARVVHEATSAAVTKGLDWQELETRADGTWEGVLADVPAGGPYRLETRLHVENDTWRLSGDRIHHLGVGDLWVVAGQSNGVGYGHGEVEDPPHRGVHLFRPCERWGLADHPVADPWRTRHPASFDPGWCDHSPWLAFGRVLHQALGIPIGLVPAALGGSPLSAWDPGSDNHPLFDNMLALIRAASSAQDYTRFDPEDGGPVFLPTPHGEVGAVAGLLWHQGCSDTGDEANARSYADRFVRFLDGLRGALDAPALPAITCQLNRTRNANWPLGWSLVREAQRRVAREQPYVAVVPTLDLDLADTIHLSARGNVALGRRCARAAEGMVYGRPVAWKAPDLAGAGYEEGQRDRVILYIENVADELWQCAPTLDAFVVEDDGGPVGIETAEVLPPDRIRLELIRPLGDGAAVHHALGHDPGVPVLDRDHRPLLGFHGAPIG